NGRILIIIEGFLDEMENTRSRDHRAQSGDCFGAASGIVVGSAGSKNLPRRRRLRSCSLVRLRRLGRGGWLFDRGHIGRSVAGRGRLRERRRDEQQQSKQGMHRETRKLSGAQGSAPSQRLCLIVIRGLSGDGRTRRFHTARFPDLRELDSSGGARQAVSEIEKLARSPGSGTLA